MPSAFAVSSGMSSSILTIEYHRRCKSARVEARVRRTRRPAPILRWFWELEHGEAEHCTSTCLSMVTAVLSAGLSQPEEHLLHGASIRPEGAVIRSAFARRRELPLCLPVFLPTLGESYPICGEFSQLHYAKF